MVRIVQIIARVNKGGTARWIENLVLGLREQNHEAFLLAGDVYSYEFEDSAFESLNGIRIRGLGNSKYPGEFLLAIFKVRRILKRVKPDIVNTHTAKAGVIGRIASIGLPNKVVHTYHGHVLYGYFSKRKQKAIVLVERLLAFQTDAIVSVGSRTMKELLSARIGNKSKYFVVYPAVKQINFHARNESRLKYEISESKIVVGWLGRLTKIKRPDRIIEYAKQFPQIIFLVGGQGELENEIKVHDLPNLKYVGWSEPAYFWPACDLAILTSDNEGMPTALIEAAMFGLPIVSLNVGSVNEVVIDGETGILCNTENDLSLSLQKFLSDPNLFLRFGKSGKEFVGQHFSTVNFIETHLDLYKNVAFRDL
jgi:glycosyltransferase involved in cell wall biosynthesis